MEQALYQAAISTFEEMGFMFPLCEGEEPSTVGGSWIHVNVTFNGIKHGNVVVSVQNEVVSALAENMLGEESGDDEAMLLDVAGELGNVICGNLLPHIYGEKEVFNLDAPVYEQIEESERPDASTRIEFDEGSVEVRIFVDE